MKNRNNKISKAAAVTMLFLLFLHFPSVTDAQDRTIEQWGDAAISAGLEPSSLNQLLSRAEARRLDGPSLGLILSPAIALAEQNLPGELILEKAMEGLAKGVPIPQIEPVLARLQQGAESVAPFVTEWAGREEASLMIERSGEQTDREQFRKDLMRVSAIASSELQGPDLVRDILNSLSESGVIPTSRPSSVLAGIRIAADLPGRVDRPDVARDMIVRSVQSGFTATDIQKMPGAMELAQRRSRMPAASVLEGVSEQIRSDIPATQILQNLFNGQIGGGPPGGTPRGLENRPGRTDPPTGTGNTGNLL
ncbi:MAG: hypothetical protein WDZ29_01250 [Balneolaceae bacterium]